MLVGVKNIRFIFAVSPARAITSSYIKLGSTTVSFFLSSFQHLTQFLALSLHQLIILSWSGQKTSKLTPRESSIII